MADLSTNQRKALGALLAHGTVRGAAAACGLGERTLYRYLNDPAFTAELQKRHDGILAGVVARLSTLAGEGMAQLEQALGVLDAHTRASIEPFVEVEEGGGWRVDLAKAEAAGALGMVRKLEETKEGRPKVELHDAQRAADRLGHLVLGVLEQRRKQAELEELAERVAALEATVSAR